MNWTDDNGGGSQAHASRAVGGRYFITCTPGGRVTWYNEIEETRYRIEYRPSSADNWQAVWLPRGSPGTLAEAKRMAEEDHERRLADLELKDLLNRSNDLDVQEYRRLEMALQCRFPNVKSSRRLAHARAEIFP